MVTYAHSPLTNPRSIRLIQLEVAAEPSKPPRCRLFEVALDSQPVYKALSYSWDAQRPSHPLECDGATLYITGNCIAALRRLRDMEDCQTLWIDSICIDQTSITERNEQVALMRDIYKQAAQVIIWLGEEDEPTRRAIRCVEDMALMTTDKGKMEGSLRILLGMGIKKGADDPTTSLFTRSWFSRMWTIQEATLPRPHQVCILCGTVVLSWSYLNMALEMLRSAKYRWGNWHSAMWLQTHLSRLLEDVRDSSSPENIPKPSLLEIFTYAREKDCSEPKDRVFALFGVLQELDIALPRPDYAKPLSRIYAEATTACFGHDASMRFFFQVPSDNRREGLPSWVVDWGDRGWAEDDGRAMVTKKQFRASGSSDPSLHFIEDNLQLAVQGRVVDSVKHVGQPLRTETSSNSAIDSQLAWDGLRMLSNANWSFQETIQDIHITLECFKNWVDLAAGVGVPSDDEDRQAALRDTLLEHYASEKDDERKDLVASFPSWYEFITHFSPEAGGGSRLLASFQSFRTLSAGSGTRYQFKIMKTCRRKCFIVTESRRFGVVADMVKDGDLVALFAGLHMPVILRPIAQGMYQFVCHAYVNGLMAGEGWEQINAEVSEIKIT